MKNSNPIIKSLLKGILWAVVTSLVLVLALALVIQITGLADSLIKPIMQIIKVLSIFFGVMIALRSIEKRGWLFGALVGLVYTVLAFFIFSIMNSDFSITAGLIADMFFAIIIGAVSAFILRIGTRNAM
jgi:putative membrane protein (TIGR04086 family)